MTVPFPEATVTVEENGLALAGSAPDQIHLVMGCCSKGPTKGDPYAFGNIPDLLAARGTGPAVKATAYAMAKTNAPVVFVRLPATARLASKSAVNDDGVTGTLAVAVTGTPNDQYAIRFVFTTGGVVGTVGIMYAWSKDGGETYTAPAALGTATSAVLTGTGLTVAFTPGNTPATDDEFTFTTTAASASVLPLTTKKDAATTSAVTIVGTPEDEYDIRLEVIVGGTIGTMGIVVRYSLDGGRSFTVPLQLGTGATMSIIDGKEDSGLDFNFSAGTLTAGDVTTGKTTAPEAQDADITAALTQLRQSSLRWSFIHYVGTADATSAGNIGTKLADYAKGAKHTWAACSARRRGANESDSEWRKALVDDVSLFADSRIAMGAGGVRITCPVTGRQNVRPVMWVVVPRVLARPVEEDPGRKGTGALSSDVRIHDDDNLLVEHDARFSQDLHGARYITLRTFEEEPGIFITRGNMMSAEDGDVGRIALRRVLDIGAVIFRKAMERQLENSIKVNAATKPNPGCIREADALKIEREILAALDDELTNNGRVSAVTVALSRTDQVLTNGGKLTCKVRIIPLGYIDRFEGTIGFENPKLTALQAA